jgi:hypothetical protein
LAAGLLLALAAQPAKADEGISVAQTANLIRAAEKNVRDTIGWAEDLLDVLKLHGMPRSRENVCSLIAVIDQESGFVANPVVPGLGRISEEALRKKLLAYPVVGAVMLSFLDSNPSRNDSYLSRIRKATTERDLDFVYRAIITDAASRSNLGVIVNSGFFNRMIEERNEVSTIGSMQVSVKFALDAANQRRWLPMSLSDVYAVRDKLYSRHGGMYYGAQLLLGYETGYDRKVYRFADYNAGRYASRNAAFQKMVAGLSGSPLVADGDLLAYHKNGTARPAPSAVEKAVREAVKRHAIGLSDKDIRRDLLLEKDKAFATTQTYQWLRARYRIIMGKDAPYAIMPEIDLKSPKITRKMTTASFAEAVTKRYQACMAKR